MKKRILWAVIVLVVALGIVAGIHRYQNRPTTMNELVEFWRDFYGSNRVVELPERDGVYAILYIDNEILPFQTFRLLFMLQPVKDNPLEKEQWEKIYTGEMYSIYTDKKTYKAGEIIKINVDNKSGVELEYGDDYFFDIEIDGVWYPVFADGESDCLLRIVPPGTKQVEEISPGFFCNNGKTMIYYNEETGSYEYEKLSGAEIFEKYYKDKTLIPGHYRYMNTFDDAESGETYNLACEFYVTR